MNSPNFKIAGLLLLLTAIRAQSLEYPNPWLLGTSGTNNVSLIATQGDDGIRPEGISVEFGRNGLIIAMQARFAKGADFDSIIAQVQSEFDPIKPTQFGRDKNKSKMLVWRIEPKRFVLSVNQEDDGRVHMLLRSIDKAVVGPSPKE